MAVMWRLLRLFGRGSLLLLASHCCVAHGLAPPQISVRKASSMLDVMKLADLRYDEWISGKFDTSRDAFRAATADLVEERKADATVFLAELGRVTVGAAELSALELQGALASKNLALYVTDVVTAQEHRRKGVARALMDAMEKDASQQGVKYLLLHVEDTNIAAQSFYEKAGYKVAMPSKLKLLDNDKLAENAGTQGQVLLNKKMQPAKATKSGRAAGGRGFQKTS